MNQFRIRFFDHKKTISWKQRKFLFEKIKEEIEGKVKEQGNKILMS